MVYYWIFVFSFYSNGLVFMKKKYSEAGKGDKSRVINKKKYADNWEKIFGKRIGNKDVKVTKTSVKKNIRKFYSSEDCKIDEDGGPYEIDLSKLHKNKK